MFCTIYCLIGIPLTFIALSNIGEFLTELYWIASVLWNGKETSSPHDYYLPIKSISIMIVAHSIIGGLIFHFWIDEMPFVSAVYFSFISITTIGFGIIMQK